MQPSHAIARLCGGILLACLAGCNGSDQPPVFPVTGKLLIGGQPAGGAQLAFHALDSRIVSRPAATTKPDGTFQLMTHAVNDGAPAGDYVVTVFWWKESKLQDDCECLDPIEHDRLYGIYVDSTKSPLRASVRPGPNEIIIQAKSPNEYLSE